MVQDLGLEGSADVRAAEHAGSDPQGAADFALAVGQVLERQLAGSVTTVMAKVERPGKVFVDWSQNALHKTTIAPYSLRARDRRPCRRR